MSRTRRVAFGLILAATAGFACGGQTLDEPVVVPTTTNPGNAGADEGSGEGSGELAESVGQVESAVAFRKVNVINTYAHDVSLYTQGLEFVDGLLLESGGQRERSSIRLYDPIDGSIVADQDVDAALFAEGLTVVDDLVWQLSWTSGKALVYELEGLQLVDEVSYEGEGWGLCLLDDQFVMSNGSDQLTFRQTSDFSPTGSIAVDLEGVGPISRLNELECAREGNNPGAATKIWANSYQSTFIFGIDPQTGNVTDVVDASALVPSGFEDDTDLVLNGIAVHPDTGRFWLTGKQWPVLYEVEFVES